MAIYYTLDNKFREVHPLNSNNFTLDELKHYLGNSELVTLILPSGKRLVTGSNGTEVNRGATDFWRVENPQSDLNVLGNALVTSDSELKLTIK